VFTFNQTWFIALFGSLESLRRGQAGALMMGIFITEETALSATLYSHIDTLIHLADIALVLINELPDSVQWAATPFQDYSEAIL
jgi:ADP-glucose pyrophosphorylase